MAKKQYIVQKYVMADSVEEALIKSKRIPPHEVYIHGNWFEKVAGYEFVAPQEKVVGFKKPKILHTHAQKLT